MPSAEEEKSLTESIQRIITTIIITITISCIIRSHAVANLRTIKGRLSFSFQSELFSPSGNSLIYMPGKPPRPNGADRWDVKIYSMVTHEDVLALIRHTDALIWTCYSPDETTIATVAWDQTIRIWDARCGNQKY
jgi:WD40 repeat protein